MRLAPYGPCNKEYNSQYPDLQAFFLLSSYHSLNPQSALAPLVTQKAKHPHRRQPCTIAQNVQFAIHTSL